MADTLDSLHHEFAAYRQIRRRGAYPLQLRQRALSALTQAQLLQLAARLGLTAAQVERWGKVPEASRETAGFFEVSATPAAPATPNCCVEVETRSGATLRLRGEIEPKMLCALIEALQRADA